MLLAAQKHIERATKERSVYTHACDMSKQWVREMFAIDGAFSPPPLFSRLRARSNECLHLSFDFAQNTAYPHNPLQPGPLYFLVERKVHIFGICCEAIPRQVNIGLSYLHNCNVQKADELPD